MRAGVHPLLSGAVPALLSGLLLVSACSSSEPEPGDGTAQEYMPLISTMEAGAIMRQCMTDLGWEVDLNEFGEIESDYPAEQADRYQSDLETCWAEHGFDRPPPPMDEDTAGTFFDLMVASAGCLEDLGYSISAPPSRGAYVAELASSGTAIWDPYADVVALVTPEEWDEVRRSCPQPERPDLER